MPDEPTTTISGQEIFAAGTHRNGEVIREQDLDQMIEASQQVGWDAPVKLAQDTPG